MSRYSALVLAYDYLGTDRSPAALASVHGKPLLDWVVEALRGVSNIGKIIVAGPEAIDELLCARYIQRRIAPSRVQFEKITPITLFDEFDDTHPVFVVRCGAIFLTSSLVEKLLEQFDRQPTGCGVPAVPAHILDNNALEKTALISAAMAVSDGLLLARTGKDLSAGLRFLDTIAGFQGKSDDPGGLSERFTRDVKDGIALIHSDDPAAVRMVREHADLARAEALLPNPWTARFRRPFLLVNPHSGIGMPLPRWLRRLTGMKQRTTDRFPEFRPLLGKMQAALKTFRIDAEIIKCRNSAEASSKAVQCVRAGADLVIAAGGDGTINSVLNGLAGSPTALGVVPLGTANVLATALRIPVEIRSACQLIAQGEIRTFDLGTANGRWFSIIAGIGLDAYVAQRADSKLKKTFGGAAYLMVGLVDLFRYRFRPIELSIDSMPRARTGYLVLVCNSGHHGGVMIAPDARMHDGLLDVVVFKSKSFYSIAQYLWKIWKGSLPDVATIEYFKGKIIEISAKGRHHVQVDGEYIGRTPVRIEVKPDALKVVC
jgi:YegS/Rv2252/BmrU family lipid kinase